MKYFNLKRLPVAILLGMIVCIFSSALWAQDSVMCSSQEAKPLNISKYVTTTKELKKAAILTSSGKFANLTLYIAPNTFVLNDTFRINKSNVRIVFMPGAKVVLADHVNRPVIGIGSWTAPPDKTIKNIYISGNGLEIDGNKANQDTELCNGFPWIRNNGIDVRGVHRLTLEDIYIHDARSGGLVISWDSADIHVSNSSFSNSYFDGVAYYDSEKIFTTNCTMTANSYAAISLDNDLKDIIFSGCIADANGDVGIFMRYSEQVRFNHCVIKNSGSYAAFLSHDESNNGVFDIMFSGCQILNNQGGIYVASPADVSDYTSIVGCVFRGNSGDAIKSDGSVIREAGNIII